MGNKTDDTDVSNVSENPTLDQVAAARVSRRGVLGGGLAVGAATALGGIGTLLKSWPAAAKGAHGPMLGFESIAPSTADTEVVLPGYTAKLLIAWGDPVSKGPAFKPDASNTAAEQAQQWGMHNDGLVYFPLSGSRRGLLVQNNEYTDDVLLLPDGTANWNAEKTSKSLNAHGVSIIEVTQEDRRECEGEEDEEGDDSHKADGAGLRGRGKRGEWRVVRPSRYARRITGQTPIAVGGPAAGDARLVTNADPHWDQPRHRRRQSAVTESLRTDHSLVVPI